jgi:hypothetical protein
MGDLTAAGDFERLLQQLQGFIIELTPWSARSIMLTCHRCGEGTAAEDKTLVTLMAWAFRHTESCPR